MFRFTLVTLIALLFFSTGLSAQPLPGREDEIADALAHAEALYYEARFQESIQLLLRVDSTLASDPGLSRLQDKIQVKLQLAVASVGLNDVVEGRRFFRELFALDVDRRLDPQQFSPKVLALADEARKDELKGRCQKVYADGQKFLESSDLASLLPIIESQKAACPGVDALEPHTAELLFKRGLASYKSGDLGGARKDLQLTLRMAPKHELATQYLELVDSKLQVSTAREQIQAEYQKIAMERETLSKKEETRPVTNNVPAPASECLRVDSTLAMARIVNRVNPTIPASMRASLARAPQRNVVAVRIDQRGDVTVQDVQGANPVLNESIRAAVSRWKFSPMTDDSGPRCVETEIPIMIRATPNQ